MRSVHNGLGLLCEEGHGRRAGACVSLGVGVCLHAHVYDSDARRLRTTPSSPSRFLPGIFITACSSR